jgi:hypothetical protein
MGGKGGVRSLHIACKSVKKKIIETIICTHRVIKM